MLRQDGIARATNERRQRCLLLRLMPPHTQLPLLMRKNYTKLALVVVMGLGDRVVSLDFAKGCAATVNSLLASHREERMPSTPRAAAFSMNAGSRRFGVSSEQVALSARSRVRQDARRALQRNTMGHDVDHHI